MCMRSFYREREEKKNCSHVETASKVMIYSVLFFFFVFSLSSVLLALLVVDSNCKTENMYRYMRKANFYVSNPLFIINNSNRWICFFFLFVHAFPSIVTDAKQVELLSCFNLKQDTGKTIRPQIHTAISLHNPPN